MHTRMSSVKWETNNGHRAAERAVAPAAPQAAACRPSRAGFTLMELLVVITIMGLIATIAVSSYFGITRAAAYSAAHDNLYNTLILTKQRAVIDGKVTSLVILSPDEYVAVRAVGRISHVETDNSSDAYADLSGAVAAGVEVYNLDATSATISQTVTISAWTLDISDPFNSAPTPYPATAYKFAGAGSSFFTVGDRYGFALHSKQSLPRGYAFEAPAFPQEVRFNPDGSCAQADVIVVKETIRPSNTITFTIAGSGTVTDTSTAP
ncbi:MAG: type II secretion system protein [Lentisphaerae bacterium]|nr:type II secretion system protein [Lentisphaerota bacterium]